jgi:hypothetical protein
MMCIAQEYSVSYVDDRPEEAKYLRREGEVKITYANGDMFEGTIGQDRLKHGDGKYTWNQRNAEGECEWCDCLGYRRGARTDGDMLC